MLTNVADLNRICKFARNYFTLYSTEQSTFPFPPILHVRSLLCHIRFLQVRNAEILVGKQVCQAGNLLQPQQFVTIHADVLHRSEEHTSELQSRI